MERTWYAPAQSSDDATMQRWLGRVLRAGVAVAAALVLVGLVLSFAESSRDQESLDEALGRRGSIHVVHPGDVLGGLGDGEPSAFIELGLLVLILTPTARVALTLLLFERQRDWTFVALSGVVLVVLVLGLLGIDA